MDDVFGEHPETPEQQPQGEPQQPQQPEQREQPQQQPEGGEAAPPAADTEKHVPLAALEAERKGRQDWKEQAIRAQEEARQLRERVEQWERQQASRQPAGEEQQVDPVQATQQRLETVLLNSSERAARRDHGDEVVDKAFARMQAEFAKNPALHRQVLASADPWREVVERGQRLMAMDEIGTDPVAFRKKVEEEVRASLTAQPTSQQPAAQGVPKSLADARSAGARGTTFTGPTPLNSLFPN